MKLSTHIGRIAVVAGLAAAALAVGVPVAAATDDGSLLSRASEQAPLQQSAQINPGYATDGALLTRAAEASRVALKLYPPLHTGEGFSFRAPVGWPIVATSPTYLRLKSGQGFSFKTPVGWPVPGSTTPPPHGDGFDWGDAAAGFGLGAFGAALLGGVAFIARRRGTLVHVP